MSTEGNVAIPLQNSRSADMATIRLTSPVGELVLSADDSGLTQLVLLGGAHVSEAVGTDATSDHPTSGAHRHLAAAATQLGEYFAGKRTAFDLVLDLHGTAFQRRVWLALADIPYGETISYAELASWVESPKAFRAVGQANGKNPLAIILPCHRVIASGGGIGGYAGGVPMKRQLLTFENSASWSNAGGG